VGEDWLRAWLILSFVRGLAEECLARGTLEGKGSLGRKMWSRRALSIPTGLEALGSEENLGVLLEAIHRLAVQIFWHDVLARKSAQ